MGRLHCGRLFLVSSTPLILIPLYPLALSMPFVFLYRYVLASLANDVSFVNKETNDVFQRVYKVTSH